MTAAGAGSRRKLCVKTFIVFHMTKNYKGLKRKEGNLLNIPPSLPSLTYVNMGLTYTHGIL